MDKGIYALTPFEVRVLLIHVDTRRQSVKWRWDLGVVPEYRCP